MVSVTDPHGRIFGFLDWSRYFFFQVAPQLCSRLSENLVALRMKPGPLHLKSGTLTTGPQRRSRMDDSEEQLDVM
jgi:hypothetical protein